MSSSVAALLLRSSSSLFCSGNRMSDLRPLSLSTVLSAEDSAATMTTIATTPSITTTNTIRGTSLAGTITATTIQRSRESARRELFGPTDHDANRKFVQQELMKMANDDMISWNFNFKEGKPIEGRFDWLPIESSEVPSAYNTVTLQGASSSSITSSNCIGNNNNNNSIIITNNIASTSKRPRALIVRDPVSANKAKARRNLSFTDIGPEQDNNCSSDADNKSANNINNHERLLSPNTDTTSNETTETSTQSNTFINTSSNNTNTIATDVNNSTKQIKTNDIFRSKNITDLEDIVPCTVLPRLQQGKDSVSTSLRQSTMTDFLRASKRSLSRDETIDTAAKRLKTDYPPNQSTL